VFAVGEPVIQLGRYALHAEIAAGGMATVYLARLQGAVGFGRTVAIKRLHPHLAKDPEFVSMFLDEARLAARVQHPNVVPTLDVVTEGGELFLVLEYVRGESLAALVRAVRAAGQTLPVNVVVAIVAGMLHGLHAAHEATDEQDAPLHIVHRDVSPQNVILGADGVPRVLDFGVAKAVSRLQTTRDGQLKGKLAYMPPEQLEGRVSRRTDIYSAGVVLWEALVGHRLFKADSEVQLVNMIATLDVPAPSSKNPNVPSSIDAIVAKAVARDPAARWATAEDMALALEEAVSPAPARDVAMVLERYLGPSLDKRRKVVAEIESSASQPGKGELLRLVDPGSAAPDVPSAPSLPRGPAPTDAAQVGNVSTASLTLSQPPAPRSRTWLFALLLVPVLGGGIAIGSWFSRGDARATPAVGGSASPTASSTAPASAATPSAVTTTTTTTTSTTTSTTTTPPPSAVASTVPRRLGLGPVLRPPPPLPSAKPTEPNPTSDPNAIPEGRH
jgi:serine/threonine-protein kinase